VSDLIKHCDQCGSVTEHRFNGIGMLICCECGRYQAVTTPSDP
jgi:hypothetical protein